MRTHFDITFLEDATETLRAIGHPIRITIVDLLGKNDALSVSQIHEKLEIEQAVASHHLRILKNKKVVKVTKSGKNSFYALSNSNFAKIVDLLVNTI